MYSKYPCDQGSCDAGSRYISASAKFVGKQWRPVCLARDFSGCICPICMYYCWILAIVPWCAIGRSLRRTNPTNRCTGNETCQDFALSDAKSRKLHWIKAKERIKRENFMKIRSAWGNHHFHFNCIDGFHRPTVPTCRSPPGFGWSFGIQQNTSQLAYPLE